MWFYLDAYNQLLEERGFSEIDSRDVRESVRVYQEHLESRPPPCQITDCSHIGNFLRYNFVTKYQHTW